MNGTAASTRATTTRVGQTPDSGELEKRGGRKCIRHDEEGAAAGGFVDIFPGRADRLGASVAPAVVGRELLHLGEKLRLEQRAQHLHAPSAVAGWLLAQ